MSNLLKMNGIPTFKSKHGFRYLQFWEYYKQHGKASTNSSERKQIIIDPEECLSCQ